MTEDPRCPYCGAEPDGECEGATESLFRNPEACPLAAEALRDVAAGRGRWDPEEQRGDHG